MKYLCMHTLHILSNKACWWKRELTRISKDIISSIQQHRNEAAAKAKSMWFAPLGSLGILKRWQWENGKIERGCQNEDAGHVSEIWHHDVFFPQLFWIKAQKVIAPWLAWTLKRHPAPWNWNCPVKRCCRARPYPTGSEPPLTFLISPWESVHYVPHHGDIIGYHGLVDWKCNWVGPNSWGLSLVIRRFYF